MLLYQYFAKFQTGEISAILERNGSTFWKQKGTNILNFPMEKGHLHHHNRVTFFLPHLCEHKWSTYKADLGAPG